MPPYEVFLSLSIYKSVLVLQTINHSCVRVDIKVFCPQMSLKPLFFSVEATSGRQTQQKESTTEKMSQRTEHRILLAGKEMRCKCMSHFSVEKCKIILNCAMLGYYTTYLSTL